MGIRTHLLISLAGRLSSNQSVHQIQGASIDPFHAAPQSRTRLRWRLLDRRDLDIGIEAWSPRCTLEAMRASLLANATASLFLCNRSDAELSHGPKLYRAQLCGRIRRTFAAWISSVRRYLPPRLEIWPSIDQPPVLCLSRHEAEPGGDVAPAVKGLAGADRSDKGRSRSRGRPQEHSSTAGCGYRKLHPGWRRCGDRVLSSSEWLTS